MGSLPAARVAAVSRRLLHQDAADQLRAAIIRGDFHPGQRLREPELARMLALSRGPVREALRQLEQEGLVVSSPHQGASVVSIDALALEDALAVRRFVEELNARAVLLRITGAEARELEACLHGLQQSSADHDAAASAEFDYQFHRRLIEIGDSAVLVRVWNGLAGPLRLYMNESNRAMIGRGRNLSDSHRALLDGLVTGDEPAMLRAFAQHFAETRESLDGDGRRGAISTAARGGADQPLVAASLEAY